jgi:ADP-heptose:LPS heptosyltransferase
MWTTAGRMVRSPSEMESLPGRPAGDPGQLDRGDLESILKILVIQLGPFGDALLTTSYFETIKRRLPGVKIHYLIKEPYDMAIRGHPLIDAIMVIRRRSGLGYVAERIRILRAIRRERFDLVIDQQNKPSSQQLTFLSGARYRLGYADARFDRAYNLKAGRGPLRYSAGRKYDILGPLGIEEEAYTIRFRVPPEAESFAGAWLKEAGIEPAELVCMSPGSPVRRKRWRLASFARLADLIQTGTECRVVLLWGPGEFDQVREVETRMQTRATVAPPTDFAQAAAFLRGSRLLICNDGGLNHLAVATATPTVAVFGTTDPAVWSPASAFGHHHHLFKPGLDSRKDDSFGITPDEAFDLVRKVLAVKVARA